MGGVGGAGGGVGGVAGAGGGLVNGGSVVQPAPDAAQHHQPFDVQVNTQCYPTTAQGYAPRQSSLYLYIFLYALTRMSLDMKRQNPDAHNFYSSNVFY